MTACHAPTRSFMGYCDRPGKPEHGGRCWQHRVPSRDELKAKRIAERAEADAREAKWRRDRLRPGVEAAVQRVENEAERVRSLQTGTTVDHVDDLLMDLVDDLRELLK